MHNLSLLISALLLMGCTVAETEAKHVGFPSQWDTLCPGDVTLIAQSYETSEESSNGSTGSSSGQNTMQETILSVSRDALQVEIDLTDMASDQDRQSQWHLPAQIAVTPDGQYSILNEVEMLARLEDWLDLAGTNREACGEWIFTWNAFEIDCDPTTIIDVYQDADLRFITPVAGALYKDKLAIEAKPLKATENADIFEVSFDLDPDSVRENLAEESFIVSKFVDDPPLTMDQARARHIEDLIEGSITVSLQGDNSDQVIKRDDVIVSFIENPDGVRINRERKVTTRRVKLNTAERDSDGCLLP